MERKIIFTEGEYYHVLNRGIEKRKIFLNNIDRERFLKLLFVCNSRKPFNFREVKNVSLKNIDRGETIVDIGAYCLMGNHFHILIREKTKGGISLFIKKLCTAYSMYFNIKNKRTGRLFENTFKAVHADKDGYLMYLFAYIHLNPIKLIDLKWKEKGISDLKKSKKFLDEYKYSSYIDYVNVDREEALILNKTEFPKYFDNKSEFADFVNDWLEFKEEGI